MLTRGWVIALVLACTARHGVADDGALARAEALFNEGRALIDTDYKGACAKFEASLAISAHAIGTVLNVALCHERSGKFASAVARFEEARDRAREQGLEAELAAAEEHLTALRPKVPHVTLSFAEPPRPDTRIVLDDRVIAFADIGHLAVDPGPHLVVVSAPGHVTHEARFEAAASTTRIEIPVLARSISASSARRTIGKITVVSGAVAIGASVVLGLKARADYGDAKGTQCVRLGDRLQCSATGLAALDSAKTLGNVGTVVGGIGLAAVAVGAYLWLRAPRDTRDTQAAILFMPQLTSEEVGLVASGHF